METFAFWILVVAAVLAAWFTSAFAIGSFRGEEFRRCPTEVSRRFVAVLLLCVAALATRWIGIDNAVAWPPPGGHPHRLVAAAGLVSTLAAIAVADREMWMYRALVSGFVALMLLVSAYQGTAYRSSLLSPLRTRVQEGEPG